MSLIVDLNKVNYEQIGTQEVVLDRSKKGLYVTLYGDFND